MAPKQTPAPAEPKPARVKVMVRPGRLVFYNSRRYRAGDVFTISARTFPEGHKRAGELAELSQGMEVVPMSTPEQVTTSKEALRREHERLRGGGMPANEMDPLGAGVEF